MGLMFAWMLTAKFVVLLSGKSFVYDSVMHGIYTSGIQEKECVLYNINRDEKLAFNILKDSIGGKDVIVLMGIESFRAYQKLNAKSPILNHGVAILAMNRKIRNEVTSSGRLVGFDLLLSFYDKLKIIKGAVPDVKKVAYLYTKKTADDLDAITREAGNLGADVIALNVESTKEIKKSLKALKSLGVQFVLYSLDAVFLGDENFTQMLKFANKVEVPLWGETRKYVAMGALLGAEVSFTQLGEIAGDILKLLEDGDVKPGLFSTIQATRYYMFINKNSMKRLGTKINESSLKEAKTIY